MGSLPSSPRNPQSFLLLLLLVFPALIEASVLAIDYGTDFTKAALMKPGVPFDVILSRDSKRKIASSVAWKGDERLFGSDAVAIAARYPSTSFSSLKYLQGTEHSSAPSEFHALMYPAVETKRMPERNTHLLAARNGELWTNEELVAMQFSHVKELAEGVAGERVRDAIVTVPAYYSQYERQAVMDTLELAGLKGLALINDGTAIAVNFALSRNFPTPETHLIYDAGASGVRATLVSFHTKSPEEGKSKAKSKGKSKSKPLSIGDEITHVTVIGYGYDKVASGSELDVRLRDLLQTKFEESHMKGQSIADEHKAIAKLSKEANRVKTILSANTESRVSIESFLNDIDFRTSVTRTEFERISAELTPRFTGPIQDALDSASIEITDVNSIILAGGASRIPFIQNAIKITYGEGKIAHNVNADEAAVLGAAFYGASLSRQFKTKELKVVDRYDGLTDILVSYIAETRKGGQRQINNFMFPVGSPYGSQRTMNFRKFEDTILSVRYKGDESLDVPALMYDIELTGVEEAWKNLTSRGATDPILKIVMSLNEFGMVVVPEAYCEGEVKEETIADKIKGFFTGSSSSSAPSSTDEAGTATVSDATPSGTSTEASPSPTPSTVATKVPVNVNIRYQSIYPYSAYGIKDGQKRLSEADGVEKLRHKMAEARNALEGYSYRLRDLLAGEEMSPFILYSKEEERVKLHERMTEAFNLLNDGGDAELAELWRRREEMETIEKPIQFRYEENEAAPKELADLHQALNAGNAFVESALQNRTMEASEELPHKYTLQEIEAVKERVKKTEDWLTEGIEKQKKLLKNDDPILISAEMKARGVTLQNFVMKLLKRKNPKAPAPKKEEKKEEKEPAPPVQEPVDVGPDGEKQHTIHQEL